MADITQTAANVTITTTGAVDDDMVTAGATITPGDFVYSDSSDSYKYKPADADASEAAATVVGMATTDAVDGGKLHIVKSGIVNVGGTTADATAYVLSETAGGIKPAADLNSNEWITHLGYSEGTGGLLHLDIRVTGFQKS